MNVLDKKNRPGPGLAILRALGLPVLDDAGDADLGASAFFDRLMYGAGINHIVQVFDCESITGITESDSGTFDVAAAGAAGKRVGTNALKLVNTAATDGTQYIRIANIDESAAIPAYFGMKQMDWRDTRYLGFWNHTANSGDYNVAGDMKICLEYDGGQISTKQNVPATVSTVHQWAEFKLSGFLVAAGGAAIPLDKIEAVRFYSTNADVADYVQYDDIIRYYISVDGYPYYGCGFPIKSATTLVQGNSGKWTIDGLITGAADAPTLGPLFLPDGDSVLGTAKRDKWGMFPGSIRIGFARANAATTAGDLLQWVSGTTQALLTDVTTTATEKGYAIALEAAGAQYDDIMVVFAKVGSSA